MLATNELKLMEFSGGRTSVRTLRTSGTPSHSPAFTAFAPLRLLRLRGPRLVFEIGANRDGLGDGNGDVTVVRLQAGTDWQIGCLADLSGRAEHGVEGRCVPRLGIGS